MLTWFIIEDVGIWWISVDLDFDLFIAGILQNNGQSPILAKNASMSMNFELHVGEKIRTKYPWLNSTHIVWLYPKQKA